MNQLIPEAEQESDKVSEREGGNHRADIVPGKQAGGDPPVE